MDERYWDIMSKINKTRKEFAKKKKNEYPSNHTQ